MTKSKKNLAIIFLSILLFSLIGCKDTKREDAIAEAAEAKTELAKIKESLASIMSERDDLKFELASVKDAHDKLQAMAEQAANVEEQLAGLVEERDSAIAKATEAQSMVEKLKSQLAEQLQKITGLEGQNKKLQDMIDELKESFDSEVEIPSIPEL